MTGDPHQIARKWVDFLGIGFHPDTPAADYSPRMSRDNEREYARDMALLRALATDPYECCLMAMADAGLISDEEVARREPSGAHR